MQVKPFFDFLGLKVKDRVTGFSGVADSICYDFYSYVMVSVTPQFDPAKEQDKQHGRWYDHKRLETLDAKPVMALPDFVFGEEAGPADKAPR